MKRNKSKPTKYRYNFTLSYPDNIRCTVLVLFGLVKHCIQLNDRMLLKTNSIVVKTICFQFFFVFFFHRSYKMRLITTYSANIHVRTFHWLLSQKANGDSTKDYVVHPPFSLNLFPALFVATIK